MRKISDLVITLEKEKGEDIEIRTTKIDKGHWKELEEIKIPKQLQVSLKTAITISEAIFLAGVTQKETLMLYQGIYRPRVEYPIG